MSVVEFVRRLLCPDRPVGWRISAPFVYSLELSRDVPLDPKAWRTIIDRIAPYATEVFLEPPLEHPEALLAFCDEQGFRFHLTSHATWSDPRALVRSLRALRHLGMLRLVLPDDADTEAGRAILANLKFAVDAGFEVWGLFTAEAVDPERLPGRVARLHAWGVKGFVLSRGSAAGEGARRVYEQAAELRRAGYNIALDDCAPAGLPGRCRGLLGSCIVDAQGNVKACRHSPLALGNLLEDGITTIWASPKAEALRARLPATGLYEQSCPFEMPDGITKGSAALGTGPETPPVELDPSLIPVPLYRLRHEPFGAVLIKGYDFVPVSHSGRRIAEAFDGRRTLLDLRRRFGEQAVLLAYGLFCEKMLRFSRKAPEHDMPLLGDEEAEA